VPIAVVYAFILTGTVVLSNVELRDVLVCVTALRSHHPILPLLPGDLQPHLGGGTAVGRLRVGPGARGFARAVVPPLSIA